jgi:SAM-dependent methyltransferase
MKKVIAVAGGAVAGYTILHQFVANNLRVKGFTLARTYADQAGKLLLVIGNPNGKHSCGDVTLDLKPAGKCPLEVEGDIHNLNMFADNQFGAVFSSHVFEHLEDPAMALSECLRVAEYAVLVYPFQWSIGTECLPQHNPTALEWLWKQNPFGLLVFNRQGRIK